MERKQGAPFSALETRFHDLVRLGSSGGRARFMGFLDEREVLAAQRLAKGEKNGNILLWGGYSGAERAMLGVFPDFMEPDEAKFPMEAMTVSFRKCDRLSHRDFLGALVHTGIERSALGDILVEEGRCVFFCRREISDFVLLQITKIGGTGVKMARGFDEPLPLAHHFEEWSAVIASARLDCAAAAAVSSSRGKASSMIHSGLVQLNHEVVVSPSEEVREGDMLSVRGKGRFVLDRVGPVTKKGRLMIRGRKYL
ncbi:MAG: YlmH/Sll1252 family protein [Oscillospiraceae bacterium]|jgi:RNA-binding protein YlmH|nr:YlmH/Sll1252 family protein [Oscillospiraceae bacterium]